MKTKATATARLTAEATQLVPAVLYLRCSSAQQEMSIDQQRDELTKWAVQNGYRVVGEYVDEGRSGSKDVAKRVAFLRMVGDASARKWSALLTYDTSRFGRLNSIQSSKYVEPLISAGVFLDTIREGKYDWRTSEGRMMWTMLCEANNRFSTSISANSIRGRQHVAALGCWAAGRVPFGFDRVYFHGKDEHRVTRTDKFRKGRGWHLKLAENEDEAATVREIFRRFTTTNISLRQLAADLTTEGYPSGGKRWTAALLKSTLTCRAYIGSSYLGQRSHATEVFGRTSAEERPNVVPALVDAKVFKSAQLVLAQRREDNARPKSATVIKNKDGTTKASVPGLLSGVLICAKCSKRMEKRQRHGRVYYSCSTANKQKGGTCRQWGVREDVLLPDVVRFMHTHVGPQLDKMLAARRPDAPRGLADILKARVTEFCTFRNFLYLIG